MPSGSAYPTAPGEPRRRSRWWIAAITFIAGVLTGIVTVGLLQTGKPDFVRAAEAAAEQSSTPSDFPSVPVAASAQVNAACLRVINEAQDVYSILTGVDEAAADVDLQRLDDIVRQLQPVEARLGRDLVACRITADAGAPPPTDPTPLEPSPSPS